VELTRDQRAAAEACGCTIVPATDDHVWRLTMQRRIFHVDGKPCLVVRQGFNETHATLAALLARHRSGLPHPAATGARAEPPPPTAAPSSAPEAPEPPPAAAPQESADPPARTKRRRGPRLRPEAPQEEVPPTDRPGDEAEPSEAEAMLAEVSATQAAGAGPAARVIGRRRVGQPKAPRWTVAGKARRGRLRTD
jgi:hypothetical protein